MQTFLPYESFSESARVLDNRRLGKQRVETLQLLAALTAEIMHRDSLSTPSGWINHPAAKMWRNHRLTLVEYGLAICTEWINRGYRDSCYGKIASFADRGMGQDLFRPSWLGDPDFHASHRSNLLRKDPVWYGQFGWSEPADLPYVWPVREKGQGGGQKIIGSPGALEAYVDRARSNG